MCRQFRFWGSMGIIELQGNGWSYST
jgi:hypothetical protein